MQLVHLPLGVTILIDCVAWTLFHLIAGYIAWRLPASAFTSEHWLFRLRAWEEGGAFYRRHFAIHRWKDRCPEAGSFFPGGFSKKRLVGRSPDYLERFARETCRGECSHWLAMIPAPFFFLWNDWRIGIGMILYALLANPPFVAINRYNRARFLEALRTAAR